MYPRLSDLFKDLFGIALPIPIYSFGAMVAVAVLVASWLTARELDRRYKAGMLAGVLVRERDSRGRSQMRKASPSTLVGTMTLVAVGAGFVGAKIFHILENLDTFVLDPVGMIFSTGGFTFYGGLIFGAMGVILYARQKGIPVLILADAAAPGLMLAYGIGRIGCHLAGDGDWGIAANVAAKPDWLPMWLWAESYPRAIIGPPPAPVYPTPLYEFAMAILFFGVLWALRRHSFLPGWLFSLYLVLNGLERFLIEQIRVNNHFSLLGLQVTQAEVIAVLLMIGGLIGLFLTSRREGVRNPAPVSEASGS